LLLNSKLSKLGVMDAGELPQVRAGACTKRRRLRVMERNLTTLFGLAIIALGAVVTVTIIEYDVGG
jgi:hypothetical protein